MRKNYLLFSFLGIIVAGYGSGQIRIFSVPDGDIVAEVDAHAGWITGMDLASQTGRLVTTAEDGIVRVRKISLVVFNYI